jgi:hypothetical protein
MKQLDNACPVRAHLSLSQKQVLWDLKEDQIGTTACISDIWDHPRPQYSVFSHVSNPRKRIRKKVSSWFWEERAVVISIIGLSSWEWRPCGWFTLLVYWLQLCSNDVTCCPGQEHVLPPSSHFWHARLLSAPQVHQAICKSSDRCSCWCDHLLARLLLWVLPHSDVSFSKTFYSTLCNTPSFSLSCHLILFSSYYLFSLKVVYYF